MSELPKKPNEPEYPPTITPKLKGLLKERLRLRKRIEAANAALMKEKEGQTIH